MRVPHPSLRDVFVKKRYTRLVDVLLGAFPLDLEQYLQTCSEPLSSRAMELGRECLKLWGYERVDEIIWVKTNQLQRIIRTGRTGHWLNHGKVIYWLMRTFQGYSLLSQRVNVE